MALFSPIAIVGRGCVLPGAPDPDSLWQAIADGRDLLGHAPPGRWGIPPELVRCSGPADSADRSWSDRGGYLEGFALDADRAVAGLDPVYQWTLHAARQALTEAGGHPGHARTAAIFGNLQFPTRALARYAESVWLSELPAGPDRPDARNVAMSGGPAQMLVDELRLGEAFALDAACASSLYAIKLACDRLHDGRSDLVLAGAVNAADDLFIHVGFCALSALSRTSRSRPFHRDADGLIPAEGAAFVALRRLEDAVADGNRIHGVIRGVGLSNDGRGRGFLAPSPAGQVEAMRAAYEGSGLTPADVSLVECHATGTAVGDAAEIQSMSEIFAGSQDLPIGSLKSNMGHGITTAGGAALLKVLGAMNAGVRPATLHADEPLAEIADSPFRVLSEPEPWPSDGPRVAAVNAFGFGGNNAHLLVSEWTGVVDAHRPKISEAAPAPPATPIAIVGVGARVGDGGSASDLAATLRGDRAARARAVEVILDADGLKFPPNDLKQTHAQQLMMLAAAREAVHDAGELPANTTVVVGAQCDAEVARYGARWRLRGRLAGDDPGWVDACCDAIIPVLRSPGVVGSMPNIPANRLNSQFDATASGFTVAAEERSGLIALELAARALQAHEADAALVGASDLSCEAVHIAATGADNPGDAAVALVLRRLADAQADGQRVYALVDDLLTADLPALDPGFGHAHAASALVQVAAEALRRGAFVTDRPTPTNALRFPAHPPAVAIPDRPVQVMSPPPALPTILPPAEPVRAPAPARAVASPPTVAPATPAPAPAAAPPAMAAAPAAPVAVAVGPVAGGGVAAYATRAHQDYVARQAAVHAEFLANRARLLDRLRSGQPAGASLPLPLPLPTPELAPPAPAVVPTVAPIEPNLARTPAPSAKTAPPATPDKALEFPGPSFSRQDLVVHATGRISDVYGPLFARQDGYARQVRMPTPPLLLADRVLGIKGEPGTMGLGTIWTETDVAQDGWYLHGGRMPAGVMIESGQADLMLISWLGVDFLNQSERVYRLLGCELTYHGGLPAVGETLRYDIHCDGHAAQGDIRLFFFHYDCEVAGAKRLSVRHGQAGFFTDEELDDSGGILWSPEDHTPAADGRVDAGAATSERTALSHDQLTAWAAGDTPAAFGPGFQGAAVHTSTPRIQDGDMLLLHRVTHLEPEGGPWGRGYLRAEWDFSPDDWFFDGHFQGDPCMPGTLMFEGCLQAMATALTARGFTIDRDGWRFEPVPDSPYALRCRGQAKPDARLLVYEVFVEEVWDDDEPKIWADLLCTVDGLKAFHAKRVGLQLTPSWPLQDDPKLLADAEAVSAASPAPVAVADDGLAFDYTSLLACAWGRPSTAFGTMYERFDGTRRVARLPGPPYHFMSRVTDVTGPIGGMQTGTAVTVDYDIPADAWYFEQSPDDTMPFAVLLEAALQPCGWLASYVGSALTSEIDLSFRNLDGTGNLLREIRPGDGTLTTRSTITKISQSAGMIIESFEVTCHIGDELIYEMDTVFGFFPAAALASQVGLPPTDTERNEVERHTEVVAEVGGQWGDLTNIDRVVLHDRAGGKGGLGRLVAVKDVSPSEWFFKAHFFQDPVQPGSMGLEALIQLLQFHMRTTGMADGVPHARFEPLATGRPMTWKYRGQVIPTDRKVMAEIEITEAGVDDGGPFAVCDAYLWADGRRIYSAHNMGMRVVSGPESDGQLAPDPDVAGNGEAEHLSLDSHPWLGDHRPTWTVPALPLMSMADRLLRATGDVGLDGLAVRRWVTPPTVLTIAESAGLTLLLADGDVVASARAATSAEPAPAALPALAGDPAPDPYATGTLFHGPALQRLVSLVITEAGASAVLDASAPREILLDAATHAIPHDDMRQWFPSAAADAAAYPLRIDGLRLWGPTPSGAQVRCEARPAGMTAGLPRVDVQVVDGERVWCAFSLTEVLVPKGPIGLAAPADRLAFLRDRQAVPGLALSTAAPDGSTRLSQADLRASDWLPGTVAALYGLTDDAEPLVAVATKDHVARRLGVHPAEVVGEGTASLPLNRIPIVVERTDDDVTVRDAGAAAGGPLDLSSVRAHWDRWFDMGRWPVEDLYYGLIQRFVRRVHLDDPAGFQACHGRAAVYLANHQVGVESLLFSIVASGLSGVNTVTLAKTEHRDSWLGNLIRQSFSYPGVADPEVITYFDRDDRESLPRIIGELAVQLAGGDKSVMVHVEGTRALTCRNPVHKMSGAFIDMAINTGAPVIPVRFVGGLPGEPALTERIEFPVGLGAQDIHIGRPMHPAELSAMPYKERKEAVIAALNALGPAHADEAPLTPLDAGFEADARSLAAASGVAVEDAVLRRVLELSDDPSDETALALTDTPLPDDEKGAWLIGLRHRMGTATAD